MGAEPKSASPSARSSLIASSKTVIFVPFRPGFLLALSSAPTFELFFPRVPDLGDFQNISLLIITAIRF